jgi:hypothetical protein
MNLSLRDAGKDKCEEPDIELLNVLNDLVEHENLQVRTYINVLSIPFSQERSLEKKQKSLVCLRFYSTLWNRVMSNSRDKSNTSLSSLTTTMTANRMEISKMASIASMQMREKMTSMMRTKTRKRRMTTRRCLMLRTQSLMMLSMSREFLLVKIFWLMTS